MTIVLFILLGISFVCAVTLVGACVISGRSRDHAEEIVTSVEDDERHSIKPSVTPLQTTSRVAS